MWKIQDGEEATDRLLCGLGIVVLLTGKMAELSSCSLRILPGVVDRKVVT